MLDGGKWISSGRIIVAHRATSVHVGSADSRSGQRWAVSDSSFAPGTLFWRVPW